MVSVSSEEIEIEVTAETVGYREDGNALCSLLNICFLDQRQQHIQTIAYREEEGQGRAVLDVLYFSGFSSAYARLIIICTMIFLPLVQNAIFFILLYLNHIWMHLQNYLRQMSFQSPLLIFSSTVLLHAENLWLIVKHPHAHTSAEEKPTCWANRALGGRERGEQQGLKQRQSHL